MKRVGRGGPRIRLPADLPMIIVIVAAVAAVALRAAARRPKPWGLLGAEPVPAPAADDQSRSAATADKHRIAGQETAKLPGTRSRPDGALERMRYVFHELHADGHHALCEVCGN
jgi:hypothetical protein